MAMNCPLADLRQREPVVSQCILGGGGAAFLVAQSRDWALRPKLLPGPDRSGFVFGE
jgi:hypothetical protein